MEEVLDTCRAKEITSNQMKMLAELVDVNKISRIKYTKKRGGWMDGLKKEVNSKTDSGILDFQ